jgi:hypothetical protein
MSETMDMARYEKQKVSQAKGLIPEKVTSRISVRLEALKDVGP